jgi:hypothetical protein
MANRVLSALYRRSSRWLETQPSSNAPDRMATAPTLKAQAPAQPPQVTVSQPNIYFPLPLGQHNIENIIVLSNAENKKVLFKIKTSTPTRYVVRPKVGVLHQREDCRVKFTLPIAAAAVKGALPDESCRDRFSIEARFVASDDVSDLELAWKAAAVPGATGKVSLPCVFSQDLPGGMVSHQRNAAQDGTTPPFRESSSSSMVNAASMLTPTASLAMSPVADAAASTVAKAHKTVASAAAASPAIPTVAEIVPRVGSSTAPPSQAGSNTPSQPASPKPPSLRTSAAEQSQQAKAAALAAQQQKDADRAKRGNVVSRAVFASVPMYLVVGLMMASMAVGVFHEPLVEQYNAAVVGRAVGQPAKPRA